MLLKLTRAAASALGLLLSWQAWADGAATVNDQCAGCHALTGPEVATLDISERLARKAPPLYYAGNKYREEWLQQWLQNPQRLYLAGYFPNAFVQSTAEGDVPDTAALPVHPQLDAAAASEVAEYLMTLRAHDDLIAAATYTEGKTALRMAAMDFRKFKGCDSCHQDGPDTGGFSGPVLYNAWQRLQPTYMVSFIRDPRAWDPNTIMPRMEMNAAAVNKLVDYLRLIGGEE